MDKPTAISHTTEFGGLAKNLSPHRTPLGKAVTATNVRCTNVGQLDVRKGNYPVTFGNATTAAAYPIMAMYHYQAADVDWILYEDTNGNLRAGKSPTLS